MLDFNDTKRELVRSGLYKKYCDFINKFGPLPMCWLDREVVIINNRKYKKRVEGYGVFYKNFGFSCDDQRYKILRSMYSSRCNQNKRIKDRIHAYLLLGPCYFLTFTLNDDNVDLPYALIERRIKELFRKSSIIQYVIHQDFGLDDRYTHRLHYHAVVRADSVNQILPWKYGYYYYKPITNKNPVRLAVYLNKLANHYIKESNYNKRVIYSREKFLY